MRKNLVELWIIMLLILNGCTKSSIPTNVALEDENIHPLIKNKTQTEEIEVYDCIGYSDFPQIEVSGEKMEFLGESYEEISSVLSEKLMSRAVRFYTKAYIEDVEYLKANADTELFREIENAISYMKNASDRYGGNQVANLKELSIYKKPYHIKAPQEIEKNKYLVELYDLDEKNVFNVVLTVNSSEEIKVYSFYVNKRN